MRCYCGFTPNTPKEVEESILERRFTLPFGPWTITTVETWMICPACKAHELMEVHSTKVKA
jgi:hypothetical protein